MPNQVATTEAIVTEPEESAADEKKSPAERLPELLAEYDEHKRPAREPEGLSRDALDSRTDETGLRTGVRCCRCLRRRLPGGRRLSG